MKKYQKTTVIINSDIADKISYLIECETNISLEFRNMIKKLYFEKKIKEYENL